MFNRFCKMRGKVYSFYNISRVFRRGFWGVIRKIHFVKSTFYGVISEPQEHSQSHCWWLNAWPWIFHWITNRWRYHSIVLTHWLLRDVGVILYVYFSNPLYELISWALLKLTLSWMPPNTIDKKSSLVQKWLGATGHRSVDRPLWVNHLPILSN